MKLTARPSRRKSPGPAAARLPAEFEALNRLWPLRPIADDRGLAAASAIAGRLAVIEPLSRDQADYLEVLATLIEKYEDEHHAIDTRGISGIKSLKYLLDANDMSASDLGRLLGERSLGTKVLSGDRKLSKAHVKVLCERFCVGPGLFLRD
jgi:HTH-type transcriptional regulator/antitoxin HigA